MARKSKQNKNRALNAFDTAVDDDYYIKGLRHQQDIDLDNIADNRIKDLLSNIVNPEDDEDIDSDEAMGSDSDISIDLNKDENQEDWGDSLDESELLPLSEVWDMDGADSDGSISEGEIAEDRKVGSKSVKKVVENSDASMDESGSESESESESENSESSESEEVDGDDSELELELEADSESDSDTNTQSALLNAIKKVQNNDTTSSRLAIAAEENPFALAPTNADELDIRDIIPDIGTNAPAPLAVPAPKRIRERASRGAAYDLAKDEISKWSETVTQNRQAEHLQFPLQEPQVQEATPFSAPSKAMENSLEQKVNKLLNSSGLKDEKSLQTFEELAPSTLSLEEVRRRRNELRYMRELMFREEQRSKRIKKIKSKQYHRVHKKDKERMRELELDNSGSGSDSDEEQNSLDKHEKNRILERATLRHKSNSKWAQRIKQHGLINDAATRAELEEMIRQGDSLREKITDDRTDRTSDFSDSGNYSDFEAFSDNEEKEEPKKKGLLGMKFMTNADDKIRQESKRLMNDDPSEDENIGRRQYGPKPTDSGNLKRDADDEPEFLMQEKRPKTKRPERGEEIIEYHRIKKNSNPANAVSGSHKGEGKTHGSSNADGNEPGNDLEASSVNNPWLDMSTSTKVAKPKISTESTLIDSTLNNKNAIAVPKSHHPRLQTELIQEVFAGDDVAAEFEEEKEAIVNADKDQVIDESLPGWGSWSNDKPRVQKVRRVGGINEKQRKDFGKKNVIINEKVNKKTSKYNVSAVPFPFENRQQYERSLRMPIGQEWVTKDTFQRQTKPRVIVKRGSVIDPIKKPESN